MIDISSKALHGKLRKYVKGLNQQDWDKRKHFVLTNPRGRYIHTAKCTHGIVVIEKKSLTSPNFLVWLGDLENHAVAHWDVRRNVFANKSYDGWSNQPSLYDTLTTCLDKIQTR